MKTEDLPIYTDLHGKVAVVTGAGGLICSAIAEGLAACGAKVALLDLNYDAANGYAQKIIADGGIAKAYTCNVLQKDSIAAAHAAILEDLGPVDILVNGAGGNNKRAQTDNEHATIDDLEDDYKSFFDLDENGVNFVFSLNYMGTMLPTQEFAKDMVKAQHGNIINISSMNAYRPLTKIPAYSGAKAAVSNFTQWLAVYFADLNIRVNGIAPGFLATAQNRNLLFNEDGTPTPRTGKILAATPMKRFGEIDEMIGAVVFLANDKASSFITGTVIPIDGGFNAYAGV